MFSKKVESTEYSSGKNILSLCCGFFGSKNRRQNSDEVQNEDDADGKNEKVGEKTGLCDVNGGSETSALKPEGGKDDVSYASITTDTAKTGSVKKSKIDTDHVKDGEEKKETKLDENG